VRTFMLKTVGTDDYIIIWAMVSREPLIVPRCPAHMFPALQCWGSGMLHR
jgi:hypothetical protein